MPNIAGDIGESLTISVGENINEVLRSLCIIISRTESSLAIQYDQIMCGEVCPACGDARTCNGSTILRILMMASLSGIEELNDVTSRMKGFFTVGACLSDITTHYVQYGRPIEVPVFMMHSTKDSEVTFEQGWATYQRLLNDGFNVTFKAYDGAEHKLSTTMVRVLLLIAVYNLVLINVALVVSI
jgi:hypothetical protein